MSTLSCGIVGLPNVGKSTLFNALTRLEIASENYPFCTIDPNVGIVPLKDPRLDKLATISKSKQIINAHVSFVDIAGLVRGASKGEGLGNQFLSNIRSTDAIVQVVRCFEDPNVIHVEGKIDPTKDIETINLELALADLQSAESIRKKMEKQLKGKKEGPATLALFDRIIAHLNEGKPIRLLPFTDEETAILKPYLFLSDKKVLYVANIKEDDLHSYESNPYFQQVKAIADNEGSKVLAISAKLEAEIAQLSEEEAKEFLDSVGLKESGLTRLAHEAFELLDLITFITTGEMETKAWMIKRGTTAVEAAGKIHTDIQKGFIRAEIISFDDMMKYGSRQAVKEAGRCRFEGREYVVKEGDIVLFYHN